MKWTIRDLTKCMSTLSNKLRNEDRRLSNLRDRNIYLAITTIWDARRMRVGEGTYTSHIVASDLAMTRE